jgi:hypothetical protein
MLLISVLVQFKPKEHVVEKLWDTYKTKSLDSFLHSTLYYQTTSIWLEEKLFMRSEISEEIGIILS